MTAATDFIAQLNWSLCLVLPLPNHPPFCGQDGSFQIQIQSYQDPANSFAGNFCSRNSFNPPAPTPSFRIKILLPSGCPARDDPCMKVRLWDCFLPVNDVKVIGVISKTRVIKTYLCTCVLSTSLLLFYLHCWQEGPRNGGDTQ